MNSRLIAFWSPTGAGASTTLLNTAAVAGARGFKVAAADMNLVTASLALAADLLPHDRPQAACLSYLLPLLQAGRLTPADVAGRLLHANGFAVLPGVLNAIAATHMTEDYIRQMLRFLGAAYPLVLVDVTRALDSVACLPVLEMADQICLLVGPDIASRFHTRRYVTTLRELGLEGRVTAVLNRAEKLTPAQASAEIDLEIAAVLPELKLMGALAEAGRIAVQAPLTTPPLAQYRAAVDRLVAALRIS